MTVFNGAVLTHAGRKNAPLRKALEKWLQAARNAEWRGLRDVRETFPSADGVTVRAGDIEIVATVFNIKGNEYRLVTIMNYAAGRIRVSDVLSHAQYGKDTWKGRL